MMNLYTSLPLFGMAILFASAVLGAPSGPAKVDPKQVKTTESGLKYAILKPGKGPAVKKNQMVTVHYTGWLQSNGQKFDSSLDRKEPLEFQVGRGMVIKGWDEGLIGMTKGEQRQLVIPPKLGYGERAVGPIPPNSTLVFDVELVDLGGIFEPAEKPSKIDSKALKTTESGLQYAIITPGAGDEAKKGQTVVVHYTGWLKDGKKFDSSVDRGEPFSFPLGAGQVIKGWDEGVQGMKVGEKRQLVIPAKLAYGERSVGPIPANSTLVFDVDLLRIEK